MVEKNIESGRWKRHWKKKIEEPFDLDTLLQDISGSNNNDEKTRGSNKFHEDSPNLSFSQFYKDAIDVRALIYPGIKSTWK